MRLAIQRGLTFRLYVLYYRIKGIKSNLEVCRIHLLVDHTMNASQLAIDRQQLRIAESARTPVPGLELEAGKLLPYYRFQKMFANHRSVVTAIPTNDVVYPTLPLPVASP